ncbi:glucose-6-phosphate dehydrogenase [bacterium]|nr:glucose-6-phosphate dehydrogenase [bacterium]
MQSGIYSIPGINNEPVCAESCVFVILGGTGDLSRRKLLPALFQIYKAGLIPRPVHIVGAAGSELSHEEYRDMAARALDEFGELEDGDTEDKDEFIASIFYSHLDFNDAATFRNLAALLDRMQTTEGASAKRILYLATPPSFYAKIVRHLQSAGLSESKEERWPRIVVEKPFGNDLESAQELNRHILDVFDEKQVFRIDHYLGKETVQNILVLRFANGHFEPTWNRRYIDHVQITVAESIGIGDRGRYYEEAGVLRDMLQNHILQVLSLVAMEPPDSFHAESIRDEKVKVLRSIRPIKPEDIRTHIVRAQYGPGTQNDEEVKGYLQEENVASNSMTETYLALKVHIENWRWSGVPFYIRSGKRLPKRVSEVAIQYREVPHMLFRDVVVEPPSPSALILRIQPDEGVSMIFSTKHPGVGMDIRNQQMTFKYYEAYGDTAPEAYERLLLDVVVGDATLFPRTDGVISSWKFVDQIAEGWSKQRIKSIPQYEPGSWGPDEAMEMMAADGRKWRRP